MSTSSDDAMSISLRRADALAVLWAAMGVFWLVSALGDGIPERLLSFDGFFIASGFFWLGVQCSTIVVPIRFAAGANRPRGRGSDSAER